MGIGSDPLAPRSTLASSKAAAVPAALRRLHLKAQQFSGDHLPKHGYFSERCPGEIVTGNSISRIFFFSPSLNSGLGFCVSSWRNASHCLSALGAGQVRTRRPFLQDRWAEGDTPARRWQYHPLSSPLERDSL